MITNDDYQLEELENAAVKKSNNAKRAAAVAGLMGASGAVGYAATTIPTDAADETAETLSEDDLNSVAETGAQQVKETVVEQPAPKPAQPSSVDNSSSENKSDDIDLKFNDTTHFVDEDGNILMTVEDGELNGTKISLIDVDGDGKSDYLGVDSNGDGVIGANEIMETTGSDQIHMGNNPETPNIVVLDTDPEPIPDTDPEPEPEPYVIDIDNEKDDYDTTITNDFEDEKTGDSYSHDYAENNENYINHADVEAYDEGNSQNYDENLYAYDEDSKEESDYDNSEDEDEDYAMNDDSSDSYDDYSDDTFDA